LFRGYFFPFCKRKKHPYEFQPAIPEKIDSTILKDAEEGFADESHGPKLTRTLKVRDLTMFGIAAIIGAGIFWNDRAGSL
jgi:amino acid permease